MLNSTYSDINNTPSVNGTLVGEPVQNELIVQINKALWGVLGTLISSTVLWTIRKGYEYYKDNKRAAPEGTDEVDSGAGTDNGGDNAAFSIDMLGNN